MTEKGGVQSVERIFQLIEQLASHPAGASLQRLAQETGLAKSTVHRLLASLVSLGYAAQEPETGRYRLTLKMFELSSGIVNSMEIMDVAKAHLERLSQRTGEAVHLVIRDAQDIVYIYKTESGPMRMSSRVGLRSPLYCTGVGKAILATLPPEEVEDVWNHSSLKKLTSRTVVDLTEMQDQLAEVRANGYAIDDEENEMGVRCVAVAIPGPDGRAESAFSISGLAPYMTPERIRPGTGYPDGYFGRSGRGAERVNLSVIGKAPSVREPFLYSTTSNAVQNRQQLIQAALVELQNQNIAPRLFYDDRIKAVDVLSPGGGEAGLQIRHVILAEGIADDPHHAVIFGKQVSVAGHRVGLLRRQAGVQRGHVGHIAGGGPGRLHGIIPGL